MVERIIYKVYGISKAVRTAVVGVSLNPENAILITDKRILIVHIPLPGSKIEDVSIFSNLLMRDKIAEKGDELLKKMSLQEIIALYKSNKAINLSDIKEIKLKKPLLGLIGGRKLVIFTKSGLKFSYIIFEGEDFKNLGKIFKNYIR